MAGMSGALAQLGSQRGGMGMEANPLARQVHHEEAPQFAKLQEMIGKVDDALARVPPGDPTYDNLVTLRNQLQQTISNIQGGHQVWERAGELGSLRQESGGAMTAPGVQELERGYIPGSR